MQTFKSIIGTYYNTWSIMLHVTLKYNERENLLQGYGQATWPEHTFTVPPTCHVTRMINKRLKVDALKWKGRNDNWWANG